MTRRGSVREITYKSVVLFVISMMLVSCEAAFFSDIRLEEDKPVNAAEMMLQRVAKELNYERCGENHIVDFCNNNAGEFWVLDLQQNSFEITFESFGRPGRQDAYFQELLTKLKSSCDNCRIYTKNRSVWGFLSQDSEWQIF